MLRAYLKQFLPLSYGEIRIASMRWVSKIFHDKNYLKDFWMKKQLKSRAKQIILQIVKFFLPKILAKSFKIQSQNYSPKLIFKNNFRNKSRMK